MHTVSQAPRRNDGGHVSHCRSHVRRLSLRQNHSSFGILFLYRPTVLTVLVASITVMRSISMEVHSTYIYKNHSKRLCLSLTGLSAMHHVSLRSCNEIETTSPAYPSSSVTVQPNATWFPPFESCSDGSEYSSDKMEMARFREWSLAARNCQSYIDLVAPKTRPTNIGTCATQSALYILRRPICTTIIRLRMYKDEPLGKSMTKKASQAVFIQICRPSQPTSWPAMRVL